jgi:peptide/nickel transport system substrate-binding protein
MMIKRRTILKAGGAAAAIAATGLARPAVAQKASVLKYVPQANLANPDPIWTTATVASLHGYMVWDTLYGINDKLLPQPQMLAGHQISDDKMTWTLTLRDGLNWTDGAPVRSNDCIPSIERWGKRDPFGQTLMSRVAEMKVVDDGKFTIRLNKPFALLPYALGANGCFIMPERMAKTDPFKQITEYVGSGPFIFLKDEWVSGASAAYAKNTKYVPRQEPPSYWSGGKVAHFDRVEWKVMPDPATAMAALQSGEIDWWEDPIFDMLPVLEKAAHVVIEPIDPLGALGIIAVNHTLSPFNNRKLLQALLPAVNQDEYMDAVLGDQKAKYGHHAGFFIPGSPYASNVGMDALLGKRDVDKAKKLVAESGYNGETIFLMSPSDQPQLQQMAQVTRSLYESVGIKTNYASMDWGTLVSRRAKHEPVDQGGWNSFNTTWGGLSVSNPGSDFPLRGNGSGGWFGWPTDPDMEKLRDQWFDAPDLEAQQGLTEQMQKLAFENLPYIPVGAWSTPTGHRDDIIDIVHAGLVLFWGVKRKT